MLPIEIVLIGLSILQPSFAASRQSFCKCVCGSNSTIIPLDGKPVEDAPSRRIRLSSTSSSSHSLSISTSTSSASSSSRGNSLPRDAGLKPASIYDPADQGFHAVTNYAMDVSHLATLDERAHASDDEDEDEETTRIVDPLAHAATAALENFGTSKGTVTTTSTRSGTSTSSTSTTTPTSGADESSPGNSTDTQLVSPQRAGTCADCNRQFCLEHPDFDKMCGEAKEEEVFTTCFQRDSAKDQLVVYTFIFVTVGLLGYAAVRPWIERKYEAVKERRSYSAVPNGQASG